MSLDSSVGRSKPVQRVREQPALPGRSGPGKHRARPSAHRLQRPDLLVVRLNQRGLPHQQNAVAGVRRVGALVVDPARVGAHGPLTRADAATDSTKPGSNDPGFFYGIYDSPPELCLRA